MKIRALRRLRVRYYKPQLRDIIFLSLQEARTKPDKDTEISNLLFLKLSTDPA